jgi:hypothetical protein
MDQFNAIGSVSGAGMRGDWYVSVPRVNNRDHIYEVHYAITRTRSTDGHATTVSVTPLEETLDRKITKTVPLVREKTYENGG